MRVNWSRVKIEATLGAFQQEIHIATGAFFCSISLSSIFVFQLNIEQR